MNTLKVFLFIPTFFILHSQLTKCSSVCKKSRKIKVDILKQTGGSCSAFVEEHRIKKPSNSIKYTAVRLYATEEGLSSKPSSTASTFRFKLPLNGAYFQPTKLAPMPILVFCPNLVEVDNDESDGSFFSFESKDVISFFRDFDKNPLWLLSKGERVNREEVTF